LTAAVVFARLEQIENIDVEEDGLRRARAADLFATSEA
jgi:hypothetical protein